MEKTKIAVHLPNVQQTLLLPLWARAQASRSRAPVIEDAEAVRLVSHLDYDFSRLSSKLGKLAACYLTMRARRFDDAARRFIGAHPCGTVVNVGAGLDTTFYRVDNGGVRWYNLDLPDVIRLRRALMPPHPNVTELTRSLLDPDFLAGIDEPRDGILFLAGGVLMYFGEDAVRDFLRSVSERFPGGELLMDAVSPAAVPFCNRLLRKTGMRGVSIRWGIRNAGEIRGWNVGPVQVEESPLFSAAPVASFGPPAACLMRLLDAFSVFRIVRLRFA